MLKYASEPYTLSLPESVSFRIARDIDMPVIHRIHDGIWHHAHRGFSSHQIEGSPESARSRWPKGHSSVRMIAEYEGEIVGFGAGGPAQNAALHADTEIHALFVQPQFRFRGIGAGLLMSVAQHLSNMPGTQRTGVMISAVHVGAVAFARALGAVIERRSAVQMAITNGSLLTGNPRLALVWHDINQLAYQSQQQLPWLAQETLNKNKCKAPGTFYAI